METARSSNLPINIMNKSHPELIDPSRQLVLMSAHLFSLANGFALGQKNR
jgi:hypothetical protein